MSRTDDKSGRLLLVHSHFGPAPDLFALAMERNDALLVRERDLSPHLFATARGLITTSHLDQVGFMQFSDALATFMARGGRWFFNGHIMRPFLAGLEPFLPIPRARRTDLTLTRLAEHPIFSGIEQSDFEENNGVAGFYGRGHNPMPQGARAINGIGPDRHPIDWEWTLPAGGKMFSHAGNDIGGMKGPNPNHAIVGPRIIAWTTGEL